MIAKWKLLLGYEVKNDFRTMLKILKDYFKALVFSAMSNGITNVSWHSKIKADGHTIVKFSNIGKFWCC